MMLPLIADEYDSVDALVLHSMEEAIDLPRWQQARLIDDPDLFRILGQRLAFEKTGDRSRVYAGLRERFDRTSRRREPLH